MQYPRRTFLAITIAKYQCVCKTLHTEAHKRKYAAKILRFLYIYKYICYFFQKRGDLFKNKTAT